MGRRIRVLLMSAAMLQLGCSSAGGDARTVVEEAPAHRAGEATDVVRMRGLFTYMADAAVFVDCDTGQKLPVAMEADYLALERAYTDNREAPGRPLTVIIEGYVAERPAMEGDGVQNVVIVDRFVEVRVGDSCEQGKPDVPLRNTYWKLMTIRGQPVNIEDGEREPHIIFDLVETSFKGYGGCNQLMGSYESEGDVLRFGPIAGTKRYCLNTMDLEDAFIEALGTVTTFEISGETLTLSNSEEVVAALEARFFE
jgi:copper homeostasis protein (lipoprotein)